MLVRKTIGWLCLLAGVAFGAYCVDFSWRDWNPTDSYVDLVLIFLSPVAPGLFIWWILSGRSEARAVALANVIAWGGLAIAFAFWRWEGFAIYLCLATILWVAHRWHFGYWPR